MSFWQSKSKNKPADTWFSLLVRTQSKWCCEYCGRDCTFDKGYLTNSHFHGRRKRSVRFDLDNCKALCRKCHMYFEEHKKEYEEWMIEYIGQTAFDLLTVRANTTQKVDESLIVLMCKNLLKKSKLKE